MDADRSASLGYHPHSATLPSLSQRPGSRPSNLSVKTDMHYYEEHHPSESSYGYKMTSPAHYYSNGSSYYHRRTPSNGSVVSPGIPPNNRHSPYPHSYSQQQLASPSYNHPTSPYYAYPNLSSSAPSSSHVHRMGHRRHTSTSSVGSHHGLSVPYSNADAPVYTNHPREDPYYGHATTTLPPIHSVFQPSHSERYSDHHRSLTESSYYDDPHRVYAYRPVEDAPLSVPYHPSSSHRHARSSDPLAHLPTPSSTPPIITEKDGLLPTLNTSADAIAVRMKLSSLQESQEKQDSRLPSSPLSPSASSHCSDKSGSSHDTKPRREKKVPLAQAYYPTAISKTFSVQAVCDVCGKVYRNINCLTKHKWEHSEYWGQAGKYSVTKHQQVQVLEAASILFGMSLEEQEQQVESGIELDTHSTLCKPDTKLQSLLHVAALEP